MADFQIKRGDTLPALEVEITDNGVAVDLTDAAEIRVFGRMKDEVIFNRVVTGDEFGIVTMNWQAADTDTVGRIWIEVQVTFAGGGIQSFPPDRWLSVDVLSDIV